MKLFKHFPALKSHKMKKAYQNVNKHMTIGTRLLQGTCELCLFIAILLSLSFLFGIFLNINAIISDILLFVASGLMYWRLCKIMANRISNTHHNHDKAQK